MSMLTGQAPFPVHNDCTETVIRELRCLPLSLIYIKLNFTSYIVKVSQRVLPKPDKRESCALFFNPDWVATKWKMCVQNPSFVCTYLYDHKEVVAQQSIAKTCKNKNVEGSGSATVEETQWGTLLNSMKNIKPNI